MLFILSNYSYTPVMKNTNSKERPDLANTQAINQIKSGQPKIGMISLGCPKALVDSERILNR